MDAAARQFEMASGAADAAAGACRENEVTEMKRENRAGADSPAGTSKRVGATDLEESLIGQILRDDATAALIDELYYEHHVHQSPMVAKGWGQISASLST